MLTSFIGCAKKDALRAMALVKSLVQSLIGGLGSCRLAVGMDDDLAVA